MNRNNFNREQQVGETPHKVYLYDERTKEYLGEKQLSLDPLETKKQGKEVYLIPANCSEVKPKLSYRKGKSIIFDGNEWVYIEDNRGTEVWRKSDDEKLIVDWLGSIGDDYTSQEPPKPDAPTPTLEELQEQANQLQRQIQSISIQDMGNTKVNDSSQDKKTGGSQ